jgi:hypothetical protein
MKTFNEFISIREAGDYLTPNFTGTSSYYKPDTMDKMAMMPPDQLAQFAWQRFIKLGGTHAEQLPEKWWEKTFGTNVFELLKRNKIAIWDNNTRRFIWNPQYAE